MNSFVYRDWRCSHCETQCTCPWRDEDLCVNTIRFINADTLQSLQIIETESHPHSHNQGPKSSGSKEGLSVYGIFHHLARTPQGRHLLRQWFLRPTLDLELLKERQRSISIFIRPDNSALMDDLGRNLRQIKQIRPLILRLRKGVGYSSPKIGNPKPIWATIRQVRQQQLENLGPAENTKPLSSSCFTP